MSALIYCYTSPSGKSYVGQTWQLSKRYGQNGEGTYARFAKAVKHYGWKKFELTVLQDDIATQDELDEAEQFWIAYLMTQHPNGYNMSEGGHGGRACDETRSKISQAQKGRVFTAEHREKLRAAKLGTKLPLAVLEKMSKSNMGKKRSVETCQRVSEAKRGHTHTAATKHKISETKTGRMLTQEHKDKISAGLKLAYEEGRR